MGKLTSARLYLEHTRKVLDYADEDFYTNVSVLLKIHAIAMIPITSYECQCSVSILRLINTPLRSTMGQERLNALSMLHCHTDINICPPKIVEQFAQRHSGCILLVNPLV